MVPTSLARVTHCAETPEAHASNGTKDRIAINVLHLNDALKVR
jgi:hypothetical protein